MTERAAEYERRASDVRVALVKQALENLQAQFKELKDQIHQEQKEVRDRLTLMEGTLNRMSGGMLVGGRIGMLIWTAIGAALAFFASRVWPTITGGH
jgi:hypothetical protein